MFFFFEFFFFFGILIIYPFFRVVFWVLGVIQPRTDRNSIKQQLWISCCTWTAIIFFFPSSSSSRVCRYVLPTPIFFFFESSSIFVVVGSLINMAYLSWRNKVKKRPGVRAKLLKNYATAAGKESHMHVGGDDGGTSAWIELGDQHPDFVYTLWKFTRSLHFQLHGVERLSARLPYFNKFSLLTPSRR